MKKLISALIDKLVNSAWYEFILERIVPKIRLSFWYSRLDGTSFLNAYRKMSPGQFVLSIDEKKLSSILVPGFMSHASYIVRNNYYDQSLEHEVVEMIGKGYNEISFYDLCKESSRVIICDCVDWTRGDKQEMIYATSRFKKAGYDSTFGFGIEELYCSELIYQLDKIAAELIGVERILACDISDLAGIGKEYISPDGLLFAPNTIVVYDSDNELTGMTGPQAESFCKSKGYL